jgi:hypothetical protein
LYGVTHDRVELYDILERLVSAYRVYCSEPFVSRFQMSRRPLGTLPARTRVSSPRPARKRYDRISSGAQRARKRQAEAFSDSFHSGTRRNARARAALHSNRSRSVARPSVVVHPSPTRARVRGGSSPLATLAMALSRKPFRIRGRRIRYRRRLGSCRRTCRSG